MGKRILLILVSLFLFTGSAFAYGYPRWFSMPLTVYMPKTENTVAVQSAFKAWQTGTKSTVRFIFRTSKNLANISNINVIFVDRLSDNKAYIVRNRFAQFGGCRTCGNRYFNNSDVMIATKDVDGNELPPDKIKAVTMQAVGQIVGVPLSEDENSIMFKDSDFTKSSVTQDAVKSVWRLYKPSYR